jgi:hypothetical protein
MACWWPSVGWRCPGFRPAKRGRAYSERRVELDATGLARCAARSPRVFPWPNEAGLTRSVELNSTPRALLGAAARSATPRSGEGRCIDLRRAYRTPVRPREDGPLVAECWMAVPGVSPGLNEAGLTRSVELNSTPRALLGAAGEVGALLVVLGGVQLRAPGRWVPRSFVRCAARSATPRSGEGRCIDLRCAYRTPVRPREDGLLVAERRMAVPGVSPGPTRQGLLGASSCTRRYGLARCSRRGGCLARLCVVPRGVQLRAPGKGGASTCVVHIGRRCARERMACWWPSVGGGARGFARPNEAGLTRSVELYSRLRACSVQPARWVPCS